jgi:hypothetical protein
MDEFFQRELYALPHTFKNAIRDGSFYSTSRRTFRKRLNVPGPAINILDAAQNKPLSEDALADCQLRGKKCRSGGVGSPRKGFAGGEQKVDDANQE